jgi:DtxR family Mn-dependent transcriptional regulator
MPEKAIGGISKDPITPSMEDYLGAIYDLRRGKRVVRVRDIARNLGVKMPAVSNMLKALGKRGLIRYEKYEYVRLTRKGSDVGSDIDQRHQIVKKFLTDILKVDLDQADEEAYRMRHAVSPPTLERFVDLMVFIKNGDPVGDDWLEHFDRYREHRRKD